MSIALCGVSTSNYASDRLSVSVQHFLRVGTASDDSGKRGDYEQPVGYQRSKEMKNIVLLIVRGLCLLMFAFTDVCVESAYRAMRVSVAIILSDAELLWTTRWGDTPTSARSCSVVIPFRYTMSVRPARSEPRHSIEFSGLVMQLDQRV